MNCCVLMAGPLSGVWTVSFTLTAVTLLFELALSKYCTLMTLDKLKENMKKLRKLKQ